MQTVKVLAFDLDGTLLNSVKDVTKYSRNVISQLKEQGVLIGLCSGRDLEQMEKLLPVWQMEDLASFLIASNGADYKNLVSQESSRLAYVGGKDLAALLRTLRRYPVSIGVCEGNEIIWNKRTISAYVYSFANRKVPVFRLRDQIKNLEDESWPKIIITGSKTAVRAALKKTHHLDLQRIPVGNRVVEITDAGISKFQALKHAMKDFDFQAAEVLSFGDDINDLEMLRRTQGVAMKNAHLLAKEAAGTVTKYTNSQEGVAYHLNSLLLYEDCFHSEEEDAMVQRALQNRYRYDSSLNQIPGMADLESSAQNMPELNDHQPDLLSSQGSYSADAAAQSDSSRNPGLPAPGKEAGQEPGFRPTPNSHSAS